MRPGQYTEIAIEALPPLQTQPLEPAIAECWMLALYSCDGHLVGFFWHPNKEAVEEKQREVERELTFGAKPPRTRIDCYRRVP